MSGEAGTKPKGDVGGVNLNFPGFLSAKTRTGQGTGRMGKKGRFSGAHEQRK